MYKGPLVRSAWETLLFFCQLTLVIHPRKVNSALGVEIIDHSCHYIEMKNVFLVVSFI